MTAVAFSFLIGLVLGLVLGVIVGYFVLKREMGE